MKTFLFISHVLATLENFIPLPLMQNGIYYESSNDACRDRIARLLSLNPGVCGSHFKEQKIINMAFSQYATRCENDEKVFCDATFSCAVTSGSRTCPRQFLIEQLNRRFSMKCVKTLPFAWLYKADSQHRARHVKCMTEGAYNTLLKRRTDKLQRLEARMNSETVQGVQHMTAPEMHSEVGPSQYNDDGRRIVTWMSNVCIDQPAGSSNSGRWGTWNPLDSTI